MLRLLGFLLLLVVAVAGVGITRGWFQLETADGGSKKSLTLTLDKDKAKDDIEIGKEKFGDLVDKGQEAGGDLIDKVSGALSSLEQKGQIKKVNLEKLRLKVLPEDGSDVVTFSVPVADSIQRNGSPAALSDLMEGDAVEISYAEEDGLKIAVKVIANGS